jgi:cytoskeletal protein RodZ
MKIKASGRTALILATGLFVWFAAPPLATAGTDGSSAKSVKHHRHYAYHRARQVAVKSSESKKEVATDTVENGAISPATLPPSIANANAQLAAADTPANSARAMTARANDITQAAADAPPAANSPPGTPDQLNDIERALHEDTPAQTTLAMASEEAPAASSPPAMASGESPISDGTSLIGKIFIGLGALLTLASAARMFMA